MDHAQYIVPPEPRVTERRVLRRPKTRRAVQVCVASGALALPALLLSIPAGCVLLAFGALSGGLAFVLRSREPRRAIVLRRLEWPRTHSARGSILHFDAGR